MSEIVLRDALGRPLNTGDKLILTNGEPPVYTIVDIKPLVHPKAKRGAVVITMQNTFQLPTMDGNILPDFLRVMSAAEQGLSKDLKGEGDTPAEKQTTIKLTDKL